MWTVCGDERCVSVVVGDTRCARGAVSDVKCDRVVVGELWYNQATPVGASSLARFLPLPWSGMGATPGEGSV